MATTLNLNDASERLELASVLKPDASFTSQRAGSVVVEVEGSHAVYVSQSGAVAELIATAAETVKAARN